MGFDGHAILGALGTIRSRIELAISFSTGYMNQVWTEWVRTSNVEKTYREAWWQHARWQSDVEVAIEYLRSCDYPAPPEWLQINLTPQIGFCSVPLSFHASGDSIEEGKVWVLGAGANYLDTKHPADGMLDLHDGMWIKPDDAVHLNPTYTWHPYREEGWDVWEYDGDIGGVFRDDVVRQWEGIVTEILAAERQLLSSLTTWARVAPTSQELITIEEIAALAGVSEKTIYNKQRSLPQPSVPKSGRSPARYEYAAIRAWAAENIRERSQMFPDNFTSARERIDALKPRDSHDDARVQLGS